MRNRYVKYIAIILVVLTALYFYLKTDSPSQSIVKNQVVQPTGEKIEGLFSIQDLERLGCKPKSSIGVYQKKSNLLMGEISSYSLQSTEGCKVSLINLAQVPRGDDPGLWAGIRAAASGIARNNDYEKSGREGNIGEYSEIIDFSEDGEHRGFIYAVQNGGIVYSLIVLSDTLKPSALLESIIMQNMSKLSIK